MIIFSMFRRRSLRSSSELHIRRYEEYNHNTVIELLIPLTFDVLSVDQPCVMLDKRAGLPINVKILYIRDTNDIQNFILY